VLPGVWPPVSLARPPPPVTPGPEADQNKTPEGQSKRARPPTPTFSDEEDLEITMYEEQASTSLQSPAKQMKAETLVAGCSPIHSPDGTPPPRYGEPHEDGSLDQRVLTPSQIKQEPVDFSEGPFSGPSSRYGEQLASTSQGKSRGRMETAEYMECPPKNEVPAKFRKNLGKPVSSPLLPEQVDWSYRIDEIQINAMLNEEPPLWVYPKLSTDLDTRRAVELMDKARNKRIQLWEFSQLEERYGIYLQEIIRRWEMVEIEELTEVTSIAQYADIALSSNPAPCPGCNVGHPPGENGAACPARNFNSPKVLSLLGDEWQQKVCGMMIGTNKMRVQPPSMKDVLLNASLSPIELMDYRRDITPFTTEKEIQQQSLYRALRIRVDLLHDFPEKPIFIEYRPLPEDGLAPGAVPIHWGPIKIIQSLQRLVHNPLVLPPLTPQYGMNTLGLIHAKNAYVRSARELYGMCRALGVPLVPLAVHTLNVHDVWVKGRSHRPEYLWNRWGEQGRELHRRVADRLLGVVNVLAPVVLTKQAWLEAIEAAE
jgi:hypothetical protein